MREAKDRAAFEQILEAYRFRGYAKGVRGIHMRLLHMGIRMNVKKIRRLMRKYKLTCPIRKPNPYRRLQRSIRMGSAAENLVNREFESHGPRAILLTDITYIPLCGRFCYLSTILDACTKQVLAYAMSESLEVDFVLETVQLLIKHHGISLSKETVIHSDQGTHYTSLKFIQLVENSTLRRSMSRRGNCWDNAPQESFFGHMKDELASEIPGWTSFEDAKASIDRWMDYYNNDRCQWDLAKLSLTNITTTSPQVSTPPVCCRYGSNENVLDLGSTLSSRLPPEDRSLKICFHAVCAVLLHFFRNMTVHIKGKGSGCVS
ncbi:MAG: IS3 family transposase [Oscillospiraceae bacterium]